MNRNVITLLAVFLVSQVFAEPPIIVGAPSLEINNLVQPRSSLELFLSRALLGTVLSEQEPSPTRNWVKGDRIFIRGRRDWLCEDGQSATAIDIKRSIDYCLKDSKVAQINNQGHVVLMREQSEALRSCPLQRAWSIDLFGNQVGALLRSSGCGAFRVVNSNIDHQIQLVRTVPQDGYPELLIIKKEQDFGGIRAAEVQVSLTDHSSSEIPGVSVLSCPKQSLIMRSSVHGDCSDVLEPHSLQWAAGR
jgi:hypothetical protein